MTLEATLTIGFLTATTLTGIKIVRDLNHHPVFGYTTLLLLIVVYAGLVGLPWT